MDESSGGSILIILVLVIINAFFAACEMAIVSINKTKVTLLAESGDKKGKQLLDLINEPSNFLATIQVGITFAGFFASASAATSISKGFANFLEEAGIPYGDSIALIAVTVAISYITLVLGELLPKRIALQNTEKVAMFTVNPVILFSKVMKPFVWFLSFSTNVLLKLLGISKDGIDEKVSREEIESLIELGEEQGAINKTERDMIDGIIKFDDILAKEVMTPRTETFCIEVNSDISTVIDNIIEENYSRIPVYEDSIDNIIGVLYMKDLFPKLVKEGIDNINISELIRKPYLVLETKTIDELLKELRNTQNHIAILIDEYGGFSGIVTLEDLVEEVIGEISDEYDEKSNEIRKINDKTYIVSGLVSLYDVNKYLDLELESDNIDTVGGLVMERISENPMESINTEISIESVKFKVLSLNDKRIDKIMITKS